MKMRGPFFWCMMQEKNLKFFSTHLLTVLIMRAILHIEQGERIERMATERRPTRIRRG